MKTEEKLDNTMHKDAQLQYTELKAFAGWGAEISCKVCKT